MTRLFRSKSCGGTGTMFNPSLYLSKTKENNQQQKEEDEEEEEEEEWEEEEWEEFDYNENPLSTPFISPRGHHHGHTRQHHHDNNHSGHQFPVLTILVTALRKSLVTCSIETSEDDVVSLNSMEISCPTDVRHVSHVTFDRFNGFLGLPVELQPEVPKKVPSASASVFGVSAKSMQCSFDERGNSVPTILLMMQKRLYSEGGLQAEGIFRITAENSQEEHVRKQLNTGVVPHGIDVHCLAGLIKAWLRELPTGVLDSLTPEQVMHCNTEDECTKLVKLLTPTEAALLDWAINLMVDVVQHEHLNKMNARNIAMVFAPNMTQMADPLTALIHAVQVMNLLKTLIMKTLREREESVATARLISSGADSPRDRLEPPKTSNTKKSFDQAVHRCAPDNCVTGSFLRSATLDRLESTNEEKFWSFQKKSEGEEEFESISGGSPATGEMESEENQSKNRYDNCESGGILDRLSLRKGVKKLCRYPVFQLSKPFKKSGGIGVVNTRGGGREETCA